MKPVGHLQLTAIESHSQQVRCNLQAEHIVVANSTRCIVLAAILANVEFALVSREWQRASTTTTTILASKVHLSFYSRAHRRILIVVIVDIQHAIIEAVQLLVVRLAT